MKKHVLITVAFIVFFFSGLSSFAQGITVVGNPTGAPSIYTYNEGGALSGYAGTPVALNNTLVLEYNPSTGSAEGDRVIQLAVYTSGTSTPTLIPNPDNGPGVYFQNAQIVFQNKLYFIYLNAGGTQQLASFDGTSITLYPNPDAGLGYIGSPRIFNNQLYGAYSNTAGTVQFERFTGSSLSLIPNPDVSTQVNQGFYFNFATVYNGKLVACYILGSGVRQLASFDGTSWTLIPNPDATTRGPFPTFPTIYHNVLYWMYRSATNQFQYLTYDILGHTHLIANPVDESSVVGGVYGFPIISNDSLFFQYYNTSRQYQLAKLGDTSTISLVPMPDNTAYGFYNTPIVYNNNLYIFYVAADNAHHLAQYQTASNSLKIYPNPDNGFGYWDQPIVYSNKLFFMYYNASSQLQLGYFNDGGSSLNLITNPAGAYNGYIYNNDGVTNNGYTGYPYIYNNLLYMQFGSVPYSNAGNLAYFDGSTLPVTFFGFSVKENNNTSLLQWKTANETNNAYFTVERSTDGTSFQPIGRVEGHGNSAGQQSYQFTDNTPATGTNYYRLKEVDVSGSYQYSSIEKLTFAHLIAVFKVAPNPATDYVQVTFSASSQPSVIQIYNAAGVKVSEQKIAAGQTTQPVSLNGLPAGTYRITLLQGTQHQTIQIVKH